VQLAEQLLQGERTPEALSHAEALIQLALQRLNGLDSLLAYGNSAQAGAPALPSERAALQGSAWKRLAYLDALRLSSASAPQRAALGASLDQHLAHSQAAYQRAEGVPGSAGFHPYHALNRLALRATAPRPPGEATLQTDIDLARQCAAAAQAAFALGQDPWNAVMQAEALLVEQLLQGRLGLRGTAGAQALQGLQQHYDDTLRQVLIQPAQREAMVDQLAVLAALSQAHTLQHAHPALQRSAERLIALALHLRPDGAPVGARSKASTSPHTLPVSATPAAKPAPRKPQKNKATAPAARTASRKRHR